MRDYDKVSAEYQLSERVGEPYALCGTGCLSRVKQWAKKKDVDHSKILYIFEDGDEDKGDLFARAKDEKYTVLFLDKTKTCAFQAADLAAWKAKSAIDDAYNRKLHRLDGGKRIMQSLNQIEIVLQDNGMHARSSLLRACAQLKIARRE
jgi:hypothetical protein